MKEQKQNLALPISIVIAGILVAGSVIYSNNNTPSPSSQTPADEAPEVTTENPVVDKADLILSVGNARGNKEAPLTLIEFSDLECPYCARFHATMDTLFEEYGEKELLAWRYIHLFPFAARPDAHPNARAQAEAAECAGFVENNEMFWTFLGRVFAAEAPRDMQTIASELGLNMDDFNACVENRTFADDVSEQHDLAYNTLGLRGTPHSLVILEDGTGYTIGGAYPIDTVAITFEAALAGVKAAKIQRFLDMFQEQGTTEAMINDYVQKEFLPAIATAQEK